MEKQKKDNKTELTDNFEPEEPETAGADTGEAAEIKPAQADGSQAETYLALAQRIQADFDNYRRRNETMRRDALEQGGCEAVKAFLPVLDNLDRAVLSAQDTEDIVPLREGLDMIRRQFCDALLKLGVQEIPALGEEFDPNIHNAVMRAEPEDGYKSGQVSEVMQKGYRTERSILRYAMVKVVE